MFLQHGNCIETATFYQNFTSKVQKWFLLFRKVMPKELT